MQIKSITRSELNSVILRNKYLRGTENSEVVFKALAQHGKSSIKQLMDITNLTQPQVVGTVTSLVNKGMVRKNTRTRTYVITQKAERYTKVI